jgi:hypothetical protein
MAAAKKKPWKTGASNGHITNLKQSTLETFDIYGLEYRPCSISLVDIKHLRCRNIFSSISISFWFVWPFSVIDISLNTADIVNISSVSLSSVSFYSSARRCLVDIGQVKPSCELMRDRKNGFSCLPFRQAAGIPVACTIKVL